ncbi:hypothetical protein GC105_10110 [Alkalibaculum sp. M08DMB]|uniref:Uncharacterized protein n=1 Tax=Alkalibaculum sporogenes TaxID=2655001 RepID=A0A6A7K9S7_9FIRM|nr:hypothetical protein [Alkalibaculum sporogenes]MPW26142.1 hypothetical protein [Alkalibaculum sporogenes]
MTKYVDIDKGLAFLNFMKLRKFTQNGIVNDYKNFDIDIERYKNILIAFHTANGYVDIYGKFKNYNQNIKVPDFYEYDLCWNIDGLYQALKSQQVSPSNISLRNMHLGDRDVDKQYSMNVALNNTEPIIAAFIPILSGVYIIDGNHRAYANQQKNIDQISGYPLHYRFHAEFLTSEYTKLWFKIESNVVHITKYMAGDIKSFPIEDLFVL